MIKEKQIVGKGVENSRETLQFKGLFLAQKVARIDRRIFIRKNMEYVRARLVFKALPKTGLILKGNEATSRKNSKQYITIAFFTSAAGKKIDDAVVNVHYLAKPKSWMRTEIFDTVIFLFLVLMESLSFKIERSFCFMITQHAIQGL